MRGFYAKPTFFVQDPSPPYVEVAADTEEEVEGLLLKHPGWRVWQADTGRLSWKRRTDLERGGYGEPGG